MVTTGAGLLPSDEESNTWKSAVRVFVEGFWLVFSYVIVRRHAW